MPLLSSTGEELLQLENDSNYIHMNPQEQLAFHRQQLKQRLGLVAQGKLFSTGIESLLEDSDITDIHFGTNTKENRQSIVSTVCITCPCTWSVQWPMIVVIQCHGG